MQLDHDHPITYILILHILFSLLYYIIFPYYIILYNFIKLYGIYKKKIFLLISYKFNSDIKQLKILTYLINFD